MLPKITHLFTDNQGLQSSEQFHNLLTTQNLKLEQILSYGQASAKDFWYDQPHAEWVLLLQGQAILQFEPNEMLPLKAGDCLLIPMNKKHRVEMTSPDAVWLALHF